MSIEQDDRPLRLPWPHFGAKHRAAEIVWNHVGADVPNYVEAFCGRSDILMARPGGAGKIETINDLDGLLTNAIRSIRFAPDAVADECQWPVSELCLHAKHRKLVKAARETDLIERLRADDEFCDPRLAGAWIWGRACWIGSGWCTLLTRQVPHLSGKQGVNAAQFDVRQQMPQMGSGGGKGVNYGTGIFRGDFREPSHQMPDVGGTGTIGRGVHSGEFRDGLYRKMPELHSARGVEAEDTAGRVNALHRYLRRCADRLRYVRIVCGDWKRVTGDSVTILHGTTAMVFDPPYIEGADGLYAVGDKSVAAEVVDWCREHEGDHRYRIALCGFDGNYDLPGWECVAWSARSGYGNQRKDGTKNDNRHRERIWFSPSCSATKVKRQASSQLTLLA